MTLNVNDPAESSPAGGERADAARNRRRILAATRELVIGQGICDVSIPDIAQAAGVGAGTIYRRFGDRAGLAAALLDDDHRHLQDEILRGQPPLGPGAPPCERLIAFGHRYLDFLDQHAELMAASLNDKRTTHAATAVYRRHLTLLLDQATSGLDLEYVTATLLVTLDPIAHRHLRRLPDWPLQRLKNGWTALIDAWLTANNPRRAGHP